MTSSRGDQSALSAQVFHILLSLADRPRHGYGVILEVEERTGGQVLLGTGTVYSVIKRLRADGWIEQSDAPGEGDDDARRKYYRLTDTGREVMLAETERLRGLVRQARSKAGLSEGTT